MAALAVNTFRDITEGYMKKLPVAANAAPFIGSFLGESATGFVRPLTAGDVFAGVAMEQLENPIQGNVPTTDGGNLVMSRCGRFKMVLAVAGITRLDIWKRRQVFATTDNDVVLVPSATTTLIGTLDGLAPGSGNVVVECVTHERLQAGLGAKGVIVLADANVTLNPYHIDAFLIAPNTAARTVTLPPAADCAGRTVHIKKTTAAAFAVTIAGNAAENIDGANTNATAVAVQWNKVSLFCDGTQWLIIA